jgi:hypothetical protein
MIFGGACSNGTVMMTRRACVSALKGASELLLGGIIHLGLPAPLITVGAAVASKGNIRRCAAAVADDSAGNVADDGIVEAFPVSSRGSHLDF